MSGWYTDEQGKLHRFAGGNGNAAAMPVGSIFPSAIPLEDIRVHLLDGSTISQTGIYEQFATLIKNLDAAGYNITCTQTQFDSDVSTYGQCGKFVIDNSAGTIRLPKITEFIASSNGGDEIGTAELDTLKSHTHEYLSAYGGSVSNTYGSSPGSKTQTGATGDEETKPKNVRYPHYIVLASGFKFLADAVINVDSLAADIESIKSSYLKNATVSGDTLVITKQNGSTVSFQGGGGGTKTIWQEWTS